jgi:chemotaxis response regulator CheB
MIVIGAFAGGLEAVQRLAAIFPADLRAAIPPPSLAIRRIRIDL